MFSDENPLSLSLDIERKYFMNCEEDIDVVVFNPDKMSNAQKKFYNFINKIRLK